MQYLLLYMFFAHIIGDFYLQWNRFCKQKRDENWYGCHKIIHALIIFTLTWIFTFSCNGWWLAAIIAVLHWGIDTLKAIAEKNIQTSEVDGEGRKKYLKDSRFVLLSFIADQILHFSTIIVVCFVWIKYNNVFVFNYLTTTSGLRLVLFLVLGITAHRPINIFVTLLLRFCQLQIHSDDCPISNEAPTFDTTEDNNTELVHGTFHSGALIGTLERLLMMSFVILNQYEAIGFLIAAKSILRFTETTKGSEKAEYVLTGTFISVAIALFFGLLIVKNNLIF